VVSEAGTENEELVVAELDLACVRADRKKVPWLRDRRIDLYEPLTR